MSNSLVSGPIETSSPFAGLLIIESGAAICSSIESGSWIDGGLSVFSLAMDTVSMVVDPIGTLIAMGLGWLMENLEPLKGWLNTLTGNADEVAGFAATWTNIAAHLKDTGDELVGSLRRVEGLSGETVNAFRAVHGDAAAHLHASGAWAEGISTGMQVASSIVGMVHDLVRDAISTVVGTAVSALITTAATVGFGAPVAAAQVATKVATLAARIAKFIARLVRALTNLSDLVKRLSDIIDTASSAFRSAVPNMPGTSRPPTTTAQRPEATSPLPGGGPPAARPQFDEYVSDLPTRRPTYGSQGARDFQIKYAGDTEVEIRTSDGANTIWADGVRYDPQTGGVAVEAKYVDSPGGRSMYEGTTDPRMTDMLLSGFDDEIRDYAAVIADPRTPMTQLDVIVSTPAARDYLSGRIENLMHEVIEATGQRLNYVIRIGEP